MMTMVVVAVVMMKMMAKYDPIILLKQ